MKIVLHVPLLPEGYFFDPPVIGGYWRVVGYTTDEPGRPGIILEFVECSLNYHRYLWNQGVTKCDMCSLHIVGPSKRKNTKRKI